MVGIGLAACGGGAPAVKPALDIPSLGARDGGASSLDANEARPAERACGVDAVRSFTCTYVADEAPACARTLDEQEARGALGHGPSDDHRELCPADRDLPTLRLDPALLRELRAIGAIEEYDELCCYSACASLAVVPAPRDANGEGMTLCIGAPESTSQPSAAFAECPSALRSRVFRDIGVLDVAFTREERAGTSKWRLSSPVSPRPCCYTFPRKVLIGP